LTFALHYSFAPLIYADWTTFPTHTTVATLYVDPTGLFGLGLLYPTQVTGYTLVGSQVVQFRLVGSFHSDYLVTRFVYGYTVVGYTLFAGWLVTFTFGYVWLRILRLHPFYTHRLHTAVGLVYVYTPGLQFGYTVGLLVSLVHILRFTFGMLVYGLREEREKFTFGSVYVAGSRFTLHTRRTVPTVHYTLLPHGTLPFATRPFSHWLGLRHTPLHGLVLPGCHHRWLPVHVLGYTRFTTFALRFGLHFGLVHTLRFTHTHV